MNTKLLMISSAIFMGLMGIAFIFIPNEILETLEQTATPILTLILQLFGALYFGFAMINSMAKNVLIGGIYSRPLCVGNLYHFLIAGLALMKFLLNGEPFSIYILILTIIYLVFAVLFGFVLFKHPIKTQNKK